MGLKTYEITYEFIDIHRTGGRTAHWPWPSQIWLPEGKSMSNRIFQVKVPHVVWQNHYILFAMFAGDPSQSFQLSPYSQSFFHLLSTMFIVFSIVFHHFHSFVHCFPPFFMFFSIVFHHLQGFSHPFFPSLHRFFPPEPPPKNAQKALRRTARAVSEWPDSTMSRAGAQGSPPLFRQVEGDFFVW